MHFIGETYLHFGLKVIFFCSAANHLLYWACLSRYHLWWLASHLLFPYGYAMVTVSGFLEGSLQIVKMLVKLQERKRFVVRFFIRLQLPTRDFLVTCISVTLIYSISLFSQKEILNCEFATQSNVENWIYLNMSISCQSFPYVLVIFAWPCHVFSTSNKMPNL